VLIKQRSVSCTGYRHPMPGVRAPAVTMFGWNGMALGCIVS